MINQVLQCIKDEIYCEEFNIYLHSNFKQRWIIFFPKKILGNGIGLGLTIARPTKQRPVSSCYINNNFTSIECEDITPDEMITLHPQM